MEHIHDFATDQMKRPTERMISPALQTNLGKELFLSFFVQNKPVTAELF